MDSNDIIALLGTAFLATLAGFISNKVYSKVKNSGVEDDMGFRLIWLIGSFGALYGSNLFREQIDKYSISDFIYQGFAGIIIIIGLYSAFVLIVTVKTKLQELGSTKIWKKLFYSAVISSVAAWASVFFGITEAITIAKVAIGGAVVFSVQLLG